MYAVAHLQKYRDTDEGTEIIIRIPGHSYSEMIKEKRIKNVEVRFDDGRHISAEQRKKAYATIKDIADYTGYLPEEAKEQMKYLTMVNTGCDYFSLSDCSIDQAKEFINSIIEFALTWNIPLSDSGVNRTDDIGKYLWFCLKSKKCCICGKSADIHHVDAIGMGNNRNKVDDSNYRKIALCRTHHTIAHQRGMKEFEQVYKVYGIVFKEDTDE